MKYMFRFTAAVLLIFFVLPTALHAQDSYEPYTEDEFPDWALDVRRFEVIMIGAVPVTMLVSILGFNIYKSVDAYIADPTNFSLVDAFSASAWDDDERKTVLAIGVSLSAVIATADYLLGRREKN